MKLSALLLLSTFTGSNAFYKTHDIITHDDGSVHLFEKTQHRRLATKNLKTNSDAANTKFTVHGSQYVTGKMHVDGIATVGGLEFENNDDIFGSNALASLAGAGLSVSGNQLQAATHVFGTTSGTSLEGDTTTITSDQADAIVANTAKVGISAGQASAITANTAKTGITSGQASAITANTAKTGITSGQASAITANTAKVSMTFGTTSGTSLEGDTTTITSDQADAIVVNTAKVGITSGQATAITDNTAKVGITSGQATAITDNTAKVGITSGQASAITANTAKTGITAGQASAIAANTAKPDPYRLEKMVLILCNTLGIKFEHLERAVDGTFDPYERFGAIQVNDDDLYSTDSNSNLVDVTTATAAALCSTKTDVACPTGLSNKHALARCAAATCVASDYGLDGGCCAYD
jgi:hypothetical protein